MKIHYLSTHCVLEYDEVSLLTELGHDVFSNDAYADPRGNKSLPRPGIKGAKHFKEFEELTRHHPKTRLPAELIEPFDCIIAMHTPEWISENWDRMKHKRVIWRSIGQSTKVVENMIRKMRYEGMQIVRYSPMEKYIPDYLGEDATIRFYKDPEEFCGWNGDKQRVVNFTQTLKGRRLCCHYDHVMQMVEGFPATIFGSGNDDLGPLNGGEIPYETTKKELRDNRVYVYTGTWPAPYTLMLIEAMMTGIPVVSIGRQMAENLKVERFKFFEIPEIIETEKSGFYSDEMNELRATIHRLLEDKDLARQWGEAGRKRAIELFGKENIKNQWREFLK